MAELLLREYQQRGIQIFGALPKPARYFFAWDMGAGKTIGAISVAKAYSRNKVLVVCPALVRETWCREFKRHWPERSVGTISASKGRSSLSKIKRAELEAALEADIQIVSYDLCGKVAAQGWDMIIVDEFHNLRAPTSKQSKLVRKLFQANPEAWGLGLSGTPIPNEAQQLWNPVDIFFPGIWGKSKNPEQVPWPFVARYCYREQNEYGTRFYGLKEESRAKLAEEFGKLSMRIVQADFAQYLPPLFVEPLPQSKIVDPIRVALDWYREFKDQAPHLGIYCHLRETAWQIRTALKDAGGEVTYIDGALPPAQRDAALRACGRLGNSIVVGTTHALNEGVSLSFQKAALIVEWTSDVASVCQFIGRFARQDSTSMAPTRVQFVVGPNDVSKAERMTERLEAIQSVIKESRADSAAKAAFAATEMSQDDFEAELKQLVSLQEKRARLWSAEEDESDDD